MESKVEAETVKVCGRYCGECVHAQWGSGDNKEYYTSCSALATMVRNTDNPLDQCPYCIVEN